MENKQEITIAQRGQNIAGHHQRAITSLLPTGVEPAKFLRQMATAFEKIPKLLECDETSVKLAFLNIAGLGLDPSGGTGEAYVLPFKGKATPIISFRGYIALAIRSGAATAMNSGVVYENDLLEFETGSDPFLRHKRTFSDRGNVMCYFATAKLPSGANLIEIMDASEVESIAKRSPSAGKGGPWSTDYTEMGRKTVLRRLSKSIPWNGDIAAKMTEAHLIEDAQLYDAVATPTVKPQTRLKAVMSGADSESAPEATPANGTAVVTAQASAPAAPGKPACKVCARTTYAEPNDASNGGGCSDCKGVPPK